jgi:hypothetical protein
VTEGGTSRRFPAILAVASALVGGGVVLGIVALVWGFGGGARTTGTHHTSRSAGSTTTSPSTLTGEARRLEQLLTSGSTTTYHATYQLTSTDPSVANAAVTIEVWRKPPLERQDSAVVGAGIPAQHQEALELTSGLVECTQAGTGPWSCTSVGNVVPQGPDAIVQQITSSLAGDQVTTRSDVVAGITAQCFDVAQGATKLSICLDAAGVPLEVTNGTTTLMLTALDHHLDSGTFTAPAPVTSSTTTTTRR